MNKIEDNGHNVPIKRANFGAPSLISITLTMVAIDIPEATGAG